MTLTVRRGIAATVAALLAVLGVAASCDQPSGRHHAHSVQR